MREILIHLNVQLTDDDPRTEEQVTQAVMGAIEVGSDNEALAGLEVILALAEEI